MAGQYCFTHFEPRQSLVETKIGDQQDNTPDHQGPVVQSIFSLTTSLRPQFVKYMLTTLSNPLLFFVEKM